MEAQTINYIIMAAFIIMLVVDLIYYIITKQKLINALKRIEDLEKGKPETIQLDGFWKKIFLDVDLLTTEIEAEKVKNKLLSEEVKTYKDLVNMLKKENSKYKRQHFDLKSNMLTIHSSVSSIERCLNASPKDIEGAFMSIMYIKNATKTYVEDNATHINCGLDGDLPYPCNVFKAVTDCVQIAQELTEMAKENKRNKDRYDSLDIDRLNIKDKLFHFDDKLFSGQVTYDKGKPIKIDKRTMTI